MKIKSFGSFSIKAKDKYVSPKPINAVASKSSKGFVGIWGDRARNK